MRRTTSGHPLPTRMWALFLVLFVGVCGLLAACGDDDGKKESNPAPLLTAVSPTSATAGGASFTLTATGSNFLVTSAVHWNGAARPTTFVSATQLTATIPASDVATAGTAQVTVVNPAPGGGTSSAIAFTIQSPPPPTTGTAEGLWRGTTNTGRSLTGLVLGSGEYWLIYSAAGNSAVLAGALQGNGTSQSGRFTSSNGIDFNFEGAGNRPVTIDLMPCIVPMPRSCMAMSRSDALYARGIPPVLVTGAASSFRTISALPFLLNCSSITCYVSSSDSSWFDICATPM